MTHGPTYIATKGACIYCGTTNEKLTDEHIVPLSLGGVHIIREASCSNCAKITSRFEGNIAQGLWGDARTAFNAPTRHLKKRKSVISTSISQEAKEIEIPSNEYPAGFVFYRMSISGILQGLPENQDISAFWTMSMIDDDKRRESFFKKHGSYPTLKFKHLPKDFGRMLIKIGYGHILSFLEPEDFNPLCLPYILGEKQNVSYLVGEQTKNFTPISDLGYSLHSKGFVISENRLLLIAIIRLYANTHSPEYEVVVGDVIGFDKITKVIKKIT
jgi:hypothetical protein